MEASFWHEKWNANEIGFHQSKPNTLLERHFEALVPTQGSRIFIPLCGKTLDIGWFLAKGYRVAGAELSESAIKQLFEELGVTPDVTPVGKLTRFSAPDIDIFVGDIFDLTADLLGDVDAIYDRAALVALPEEMRGDYARQVTKITGTAPQLLLTFEYEQSEMTGPPFSIDGETVEDLYSDIYRLSVLERAEVRGGLKGRVNAEEVAWHLGKA
ncbi:thiopurine S-methyltransferase [Sneathiella sp.]|uniref:thiopurine S-methyltransferase n=1 Tax=Sneathiella sp. TaxID=1964365 RepID=UPI0026305B37|nr:thiopurine S-methyltransferase [Sneathiella sp.]MDF2367302.1 thiopurine S-methyltransferase [Sneathiella sp.]